jgi:hypothetical protein
MPNPIKDWPHAPVHRLGNDGVFMVTGATLYKQHLFSGRERWIFSKAVCCRWPKSIFGSSKRGPPSQITTTSWPEATATQKTSGCFSITFMVKLPAS